MPYKVGDKVQMKYLTDQWHDVIVTGIRPLTEEEAGKYQSEYPGAKAGHDVLLCSQGGMNDPDIRAVVDWPGQVREMPPEIPSVETGSAFRPMAKIQLKSRRQAATGP